MDLSTTLKNVRAGVIADHIDLTDHSLRLVGSAGQIICDLPFVNPSAASVTGGVLTFNTLPESMTLLSGTIVKGFIIADADNSLLIDNLSVGNFDSSADIRLPNTYVYKGSLLRLSGWTLSEL